MAFSENLPVTFFAKVGTSIIEKVEQFLTQPYVVAEPFTDIPGEYVRLEDTIRSFKALLDGHYDDVPEKAFWMVGDIDQAIAKKAK